MDPYGYELDLVIEFLNQLFKNKKSFSTINSYKSALKLVFTIKKEDDDMIKRFMRGIYNIKPSKPKYSSTWDPHPVLKNLESKYPLEQLTLEQLTKKLVTLLALISAHRVQTFSLITINNIRTYEDRLEIRVPDRIKTSRKNSTQPLLIIPFFYSNPGLCLARTIQFYINKTQQDRPSEELGLILTHRKPYHAATTQSISRWIKSTLLESGIDTAFFQAHSTRHAATSAALRAGVDVEEIRKSAGWSQKTNTFNVFYNKPVVAAKNSFALGVLKGSSVKIIV